MSVLFGNLSPSCVDTQTCTNETSVCTPVGYLFKSVMHTARMNSAWIQYLL